MAHIKAINATVEIPIYNISSRSFKNKIFQIATNDKFGRNDKGNLVVKALKCLNFEFSKGDRVGIIGKNGSGKSTLLRVLSGAYKPTTGNFAIQGKIASLIDISLGIDHEATGKENIYLRGAFLGMSKKEMDKKFDDIVSFSELENFINLPVRTYSSGMHLKLAFSVSTIIQPEILLMDEWLSVGDEEFKKKAEKRLNDLVKTTEILVIASHSRDLIEKNCNKVILLEDGIIKSMGAPKEICSSYFDNPQPGN